MANQEIGDYGYLFGQGIPIIDVRAPSEFIRGAPPSAVNLPILDDSERREVGLAYKNLGQEAAIAKGWELVEGTNRSQKIDSWRRFAANHPNAVVCCWRGGLRSQLAQEWLANEGVELPRVQGGFKALRQYSLSLLDSCSCRSLVVLAGRTGSGKTQLIQELAPSIDLEYLANHRGSAFGRMSSPQPTPIEFEFAVALQLLKKPTDRAVLVEDESSLIGSLKIPEPFYGAMLHAPLVVVAVPLEERVKLTYDSYVLGNSQEMLVSSLNRIKKRLGGLRFKEVLDCLNGAFLSNRPKDHYQWIEMLLSYYYDPMYDYQLGKKQYRIEFEGTVDEACIFLDESFGIN
ncbi:MAG: tRNA 2-selenouridine(34) synthase MnmH [Gammaproteobacteria bacterium]|nr:tRNA 2-selenouridine(34) synthase MnmH [Gammaproteobacteria bacterium]